MFRKIIIVAITCLLVCGIAGAAENVHKNPVVFMKTSMGDITIELFQKEAPMSVKNFLAYIKGGHYSNTIFHRVIPGFMIQGGGFTADMKVKQVGKPIKNESSNGLKNDRGTVAMARTADPDSATAQFFINVVNNSSLNRPLPDGYGYAVFGRVIKGMDVVDSIAGVRTGMRMGFADVPQTPIVIKSINISK